MGAIIGKVELYDCRPSYEVYKNMIENNPEINQEEIEFGDYSPGRWVWMLRNPVKFSNPIPWKGSLSIWTVNIWDLPTTPFAETGSIKL